MNEILFRSSTLSGLDFFQLAFFFIMFIKGYSTIFVKSFGSCTLKISIGTSLNTVYFIVQNLKNKDLKYLGIDKTISIMSSNNKKLIYKTSLIHFATCLKILHFHFNKEIRYNESWKKSLLRTSLIWHKTKSR